MQKIPIIEALPRNGNAVRLKKATYSHCRPLPASYMSEYSVIGLTVDDLAKTLNIVRGNGIPVTEETFGAEITIPDRNRLPELVRQLLSSGVYCTLGDIIDSIYQG